jgi:hypothetical protein
MKIHSRKWFVAYVALLFLLLAWANRHNSATQGFRLWLLKSPLRARQWSTRLYTPTQIVKLGQRYFIVDCFHNRVIYSDKEDAPIAAWKTMDTDIGGPHSITTDGMLYLVDDTGHGSLRVYSPLRDGYKLVQTISNIGYRPHRVRYDETTKAFYAFSANSQQMTKLVRDHDRLRVEYTKLMTFLDGLPARSFSFDHGAMLFVVGENNRFITRVQYNDDSYRVLQRFSVPVSLTGEIGMNDIFWSGRYYYVTASNHLIVRAPTLEDLSAGRWEDLYGKLGFQGTPYYIEAFDGRIWIPEISQYSGIKSFIEDGDAFKDIKEQFANPDHRNVDEQISLSEPH